MADETPPVSADPAVCEVPLVPPAPSIVSVDLTESADSDKTVLDGVMTQKMTPHARMTRLGRIKSPLGRFVASRMLEKPSKRESELMHHRAKVAFVDGASMCVPVLFNEIGAKSPNKVRIDAALAVLRGAGVMVDSVPVSAEERKKEIDTVRKLAERSTDEIKAGVMDKIAAMRREEGR